MEYQEAVKFMEGLEGEVTPDKEVADRVQKLLELTDEEFRLLDCWSYEYGRTLYPENDSDVELIRMHTSLSEKLGIGVGDLGVDR